MKRYSIYALSALLLAGACVKTIEPDFNVPFSDIEAEAVGGDVKVKLDSPEA